MIRNFCRPRVALFWVQRTRAHRSGAQQSAGTACSDGAPRQTPVTCADDVSQQELLREAHMTQQEVQLIAAHSKAPARSPDEAARRDWTEPSLDDLDRSIPQVDCAFIADLIRARNKRRKEFLQKKVSVESKVVSLTKDQALSVKESASYPVLQPLRASDIGVTAAVAGTTVVYGEGDAANPVSPQVLAKLTDEERDVLLSQRPEYDDGFVLLDCRTVNEVTSWGIIEGAKVLPAHEMFDGFHLTPEEFEVEFGFSKPRPEEKIICYCQYGPRSLMAAQVLSWMGYTNVLHFRDGYYEWGKQYNLLLRRWMLHDKESGNECRRQVVFQAGLELQREIAPEFNELPMREAARYKIDTTRSRGELLVGEGVREEAYKQVRALVEDMEPPQLPGVLDVEDHAVAPSRAVGCREQHFQRFLQETTGMDALEEVAAPLSVGEAQEKAINSFGRRDDNGRVR